MDADKGFFLNGHPYPLRGVAMHQDWDGSASAVSYAQFDQDYSIIKELGANFLRLAHYPHNDYALSKCDELGIIVQTEVPWVNNCGVKATTAYFDNIHQQMKEMITNLYNHPAIAFWGMWNELDTWGNNDKLQGRLDCAKVTGETAKLYDYAKSLDPHRFVGMSDCSSFKNEGYAKLKGDYFSENRYNGWYYSKMDEFSGAMKAIHQQMGVVNVSEYGLGINPFCHSLEPEKTTKKGTGGSRHDEEYGNIFHESYVRQIMKMPFLNFTSLWVMFDFPVANRMEGYMDTDDGVNFTESEARKFMNDKGLVTRDRKTKKDVFYLYKSLWNNNVQTVYITSRRFSKRPADAPIYIKVYSNAKKLTLYQNGTAVETMNGSGEETGVIWKFKPLKFLSDNDTFKVVSDEGTSDEISLQRF
jgi:beta-galactosidase/beta-glucuronidase